MSADNNDEIKFTDLPSLIVEKILRLLTYEELSHLRLTCKFIKRPAEKMLNDGFFLFGRKVSNSATNLKRQLPKKESARRSHPLSRYSEVFSALETRYTLMAMTYKKYIDRQLCCFIPGKVLDIGFGVVKQVKSYLDSGRPASTVMDVINILRDVRDYSSMAMEHFDEHIAPGFPLVPLLKSSYSQYLSGLYTRNCPSLFQKVDAKSDNTPVSSQGSSEHCYYALRNSMEKQLDEQNRALRNEMKKKFDEQNQVLDEQRRLINEQGDFIRQIFGFLGEMGEQSQWTPQLKDDFRRLSSNYDRAVGRDAAATLSSSAGGRNKAVLPAVAENSTPARSLLQPYRRYNKRKQDLNGTAESMLPAKVKCDEERCESRYFLRKRK